MRQRARVDRNHREIVEALEAMGWGVISTAQLGNGFPDLVAMKAGRVVFVEVKDGARVPSERKLKPVQVEAHKLFERYGVHVHVVCSANDLQQLDRDARQRFEGVAPRNFYPEANS